MKRLIKKNASISQSMIEELGEDWENYTEHLYQYIHGNDKSMFAILQTIIDKHPNFKNYLNSLVAGQTLYRGIRVDKDRTQDDMTIVKSLERDYASASTSRDWAVYFANSEDKSTDGLIITYQATECIFHYQMLNEDIDPDWELEKEVIINTSTATIISIEQAEVVDKTHQPEN